MSNWACDRIISTTRASCASCAPKRVLQLSSARAHNVLSLNVAKLRAFFRSLRSLMLVFAHLASFDSRNRLATCCEVDERLIEPKLAGLDGRMSQAANQISKRSHSRFVESASRTKLACRRLRHSSSSQLTKNKRADAQFARRAGAKRALNIKSVGAPIGVCNNNEHRQTGRSLRVCDACRVSRRPSPRLRAAPLSSSRHTAVRVEQKERRLARSAVRQ